MPKFFRFTAALCFSLGLAQAALAHGDAATPAASTLPAEQTAWGIAGKPGELSRTLHIEMNDKMRFVPEKLQIKQGETIRFVIRNAGKRLHEMVLGTPAALAEHAALMKKFPKMEHAEAHMSHVAAQKSGEILWRFNRSGTFELACLVGRHYEKGMRGAIEVTP